MRIVLREWINLLEMVVRTVVVTIHKADITHTDIVTLTLTDIQSLVVYLLENLLCTLEVSLITLVASPDEGHSIAVDTCGISLHVICHKSLDITTSKLHSTHYLIILNPLYITSLCDWVKSLLKLQKGNTCVAPTIALKHTLDMLHTHSLIWYLCRHVHRHRGQEHKRSKCKYSSSHII